MNSRNIPPRKMIGRAYIAVRLGHIGVRVRVLQSLLSRIQRPSSDVDLLTQGGSVSLHEGVHVLPAVKVADATDISLHDRLGGVAGSIAKDETLDVGGADLATVVDDVAGRRNHDLGGVETGKVDFGVAKRDVDLVVAGGLADAAHLIGVGRETVLAVFLQQGEAFLVVDFPHPVGVAGDPWFLLECDL